MKAAQAEMEKAFAGTESEKALRLSLESKLSEMKKMREGDLEMAAVLEGKDRWAHTPVRLRCPFVWPRDPLPGLPAGASGKEPTCQGRRHDTWVPSLGWEGPLGKEMAAHSSVLAWGIPWTEEPAALQSMGSQRVGHDCSVLA